VAKKKHPEHVNHERWLVSYADFITLLFAFFVIMYAISQADKAKFQAVAQSLRNALGAVSAQGVIESGGGGGGHSISPFEAQQVSSGGALPMPAGKTNTARDSDPDLPIVRDQLEESISLQIGTSDPSERAETQYNPDGLMLRLAARGYYAAGAEAPPRDLWPMFDRVGRILLVHRRSVRLEGHADTREIRETKSGYRESMALSLRRAQWLMNRWVDALDYPPELITIAGRGHYQPLAAEKGKSPQGRGTDSKAVESNRRVEILILKK